MAPGRRERGEGLKGRGASLKPPPLSPSTLKRPLPPPPPSKPSLLPPFNLEIEALPSPSVKGHGPYLGC